MPTRRTFLQLLAAAALIRPAWASTGTPRLVLVLLRGGLDGLHLLPPHGDPDYARARGDLAIRPADGLIDLDGTFGLHPALSALVPAWRAGELLPVHATAHPYRGRSHFDAQDALESGADPHLANGWLGRALAAGPKTEAVALSRQLPRVLHGLGTATSIDPSVRADPGDPFLDAVASLYAMDPTLGDALQRGREGAGMVDTTFGGRTLDLSALIHTAAAALRSAPVLVTDVGGWDSHQRQRGLDARLRALAEGLALLREASGDAWAQTVVVAITEFGRTIAPNGTDGTDHGTGGAALVLGGPVRGGRVLADWPGLADRLDGRDLRPTRDLRTVLAGVLHDHLRLSKASLTAAFPDGVLPAVDLLR